MQELIDYLLKEIVDSPDKIKIKKSKIKNITVLELSADPRDIGKIIGKEGRVIKAIRVITNAATIKDDNKVVIQLADNTQNV